MLHDIIYALLGFTGEVVVSSRYGAAEEDLFLSGQSVQSSWLEESQKMDVFQVQDGYPFLTEAEREQINRIVPLGWFYNRLQGYVESYDMSWTKPAFDQEVYKMALAAAIQDLLQEYVSDIARLEELINQESTLPLSHFLQHVQKYMIVFPQFHQMLMHVEEQKLRGCQILDYFAKYASGVPVLTDLIRRILFRLRAVMCKQIFAWMIFGELSDESKEFFIQTKEKQPHDPQHHALSFEQRVLLRLAEAKVRSDKQASSAVDSTSTFEWSSTYFMRLENVPDSHISPILATKVIFAGKAALMLQQQKQTSAHLRGSSSNQTGAFKTANLTGSLGADRSDAFTYLSRGSVFATEDDEEDESEEEDEDDEEDEETSDEEDSATEQEDADVGRKSNNKATKASSPNSKLPKPSTANVKKQKNATKAKEERGLPELKMMSYSSEEIQSFDKAFQKALQDNDRCVELLEDVIEQVCEMISNRLWGLLKEELGFMQYLHLIRNTYLLGKGELFQCILDDIHALTYQSIPKVEDMDEILNWKVLRNACKLMGLDDDDAAAMLKLRIDNASVHLVNFLANDHRFLTFNGAVKFDTNVATGTPNDDANEFTRNLQATRSVQLSVASPPESYHVFQALWKERNFFGLSTNNGSVGSNSPWTNPKASVLPTNPATTAAMPSTPDDLEYLNSSLWYNDTKYVVKGFKQSFSFNCQWKHAKTLSSQHVILKTERARNPAYWPVFPSMLQSKYVRGRDVILGSIATSLHADHRTIHSVGKGELSREISNSLHVGVSFHACMSNHEHTENIVKYYARLYVVRGGNEGLWKLPTNRSLTMNVFSNTAGSASAAPRDTASERSRIGEANSEYVIAEKIIDLDDNFAHYMSADQLKSLTTFGKMKLEVDYSRVLNYQPGGSNASAAGSTLRQSTSTMGAGDFAGNSTFGGTGSVGVGAVSYKLRIRLVDDSNELENMTTGTATNGTKSNKNDSYLDDLQATAWDLEVPLDLSLFVKCTGGQSWVGVVSAGLLLDNQAFLSAHEYLQQQEQQKNALPWQQNSAVGQPRAFSLQLYALHFESKGTLFSFPVCSPYTSARHPDTFLKMEEELAKIRTWMNIKMQFQFPPLFKVIFDAESVRHYERIFSLVMKIRFVSRMLEKLWMSRSKFLTDRLFCNIRHAMHFFISNLLYYLQVDVVDSEYARLLQELEHVTDFQSVLKHHKHFIANILRLSMIDNMGIQESMDRIVQVCLRFVAACRLQSKSEFQYDLAQDDKPSFGSRPEVAKGKEGTDGAQSNSHSASQPPVYIPIEEFEAIRKEFYLQVSYLFQFMRKVESRGFLFRLDFNGFLSQASLDS